MNAFAIAATCLLALLAPLGAIAVRREPVDGLVALELAGAIVVLVLVCLAEGLHRSTYYGVAVIAAVAFFVGSLVYTRFLGRWL